VSDLYYDPFDFEIDDDPFPVYRRLREEAPVYRNEKFGFYALSRFADVKEALADASHFSSVDALTLEEIPVPPSIITMDAPVHTRQRSLVSRVFTPRRVAGLEDSVRAITRRFLDDLGTDGDLVEDFTSRLPVAVICQLLGIPEADHEQMRTWTKALANSLELGEDGAPKQDPAIFEAAIGLAAYFEEMVAERRQRPTDDLVSALAHAQENGEQFSHDELLGFLSILLLAGNDTTNLLLGNMAYWMTRFPDQRRLLLDDADLAPSAIEETMRFDNSIHVLVRTLPEPVTLHGVDIDPSHKMVLILGSGNRDDRQFADPDRYDITRHPEPHLGLGHGVHFCVGAALARLEVRVALEEMVTQLADFEVDIDEGVRARVSSFRGFASMPFRATAR
jgi:cytochrome P450